MGAMVSRTIRRGTADSDQPIAMFAAAGHAIGWHAFLEAVWALATLLGVTGVAAAGTAAAV